jgi:DNA-binding response OmpR family regulator
LSGLVVATNERPTVLVVEDDQDVLALIAAILTDEGYDVQTAVDGAEALPLILEHPPAAVVLDLWLPRLDGRAFGRMVREWYGHRIGIVVCSATRDTPEWAAEVEAEAVIEKPFTLDQLLAAVATACPQPVER